LKALKKIWRLIYSNPQKAIVATAILVRLLLALLYQHVTIYPDSEDYIALAERLMAFDLSGYTGERTPGYPLFLILSGADPIISAFLQSIIGVITLIVVYKTFLISGIGRKGSLITTLLLSCYLPVGFFEFAILSEALTFFVVSLVFYYLFIQRNRGDKLSLCWLVTMCCLLVLIKPFYVFLPFILFAVLYAKRRRLYQYIWLLILPLFLFLGWSYINKVNTGYFVSTTFYGFNLAQNCVSFAEKTTPEYAEIGEIYARYRDRRISDKEEAMVIWDAYPELKDRTGLSLPDLSHKLYEYSIATIKNNPGAYFKQICISWADFWKTSLYWEPYSFEIEEASGPLLYIAYAQRIVLQMVKILFVLLIPYNIISAWRRKKIKPTFVISVVVLAASILQAFVTYGTNSRFSYPFEALIVLSVVLNIIVWVRARRKRKNA